MFIGVTKTYNGQISAQIYFNTEEGAIGAIVFSRAYDFTEHAYGETFQFCTVYFASERVGEEPGFEVDIEMGRGILAAQGWKDIEPVSALMPFELNHKTEDTPSAS